MGDEEAMGQVLNGGCLTTGLEPRWLFVWRNRPGIIPYDDISEHRLQRIGHSMTQYMQDYDETLPPLTKSQRDETGASPVHDKHKDEDVHTATDRRVVPAQRRPVRPAVHKNLS